MAVLLIPYNFDFKMYAAVVIWFLSLTIAEPLEEAKDPLGARRVLFLQTQL